MGCYLFSGTVFYESILAEEPDALSWLTVGPDGKYPTYKPFYFRRWVNRSHPGVRAHMRELVRFAAQEAEFDLIHFDNYWGAPGYEPYAVQQFRQYLENKYTPEDGGSLGFQRRTSWTRHRHRHRPRPTLITVIPSTRISLISDVRHWRTLIVS